jgi:hypothetical protein
MGKEVQLNYLCSRTYSDSPATTTNLFLGIHIQKTQEKQSAMNDVLPNSSDTNVYFNNNKQ